MARPQSELIQLLNERAECYQRLHEYQACIKDCDQILKLDTMNIQANKRKVTCVFGLKQYPEANRLIQQLIAPTVTSLSNSTDSSSTSINSTEGTKENPYKSLLSLQKRIELELKGIYDMTAIREECFTSLTPTIPLTSIEMHSIRSHRPSSGPCVRLSPHGDYIHPMIECVTIPEKGVGLRLKSFSDSTSSISSIPTSTILKGTLLMCSTAIFIEQKSDTQPADLLAKMKRKLNDQPELLAQIQRLFSHTKFNSDRMKLIQQINPIQLSQQPLISTSTTTNHPPLNDEQLRLAFDRNSFGGGFERWNDHGVGGSGLWFIPSLFNHSCISNCDWRPFGDLMFIYADRVISVGEELTINYCVLPTRSFLIRQQRLATWEFQCHCPYCHYFYQFPKLIQLEQDLIHLCNSVSESLTPSMLSSELVRLLNRVEEDGIRPWYDFINSHVPSLGLTTSQGSTSSFSIVRPFSSTPAYILHKTFTFAFITSPLIIRLIRPFRLQVIILNKLLNRENFDPSLRTNLQDHRLV